MEEKRLPLIRLLAIASLGFALTILTNTLDPAVLGHKVLELAPGQRNTAFGFATFAGLIVAIIAQPIVGALSDRTQSRWGRRIPYFVAGVVVVAICLYFIASAANFAFLVGGVLLLQFGVTAIQGPWQALIPDQVPVSQHGQASGVKVMLDIVGLVVGRYVAGQVISRVPLWGETAVLIAVIIPIAIFGLALAVTARSAREDPAVVESAPRSGWREALPRAFLVDLRASPSFARWFVSRLLFWCAFIGLSIFLLFYAIDVLGMSEAAAQQYTGQVSALLGVALLIILLPASWLTDRIGRKPLLILSNLVAALGTTFILTTRDRTLITIGAGVVGAGVGTFMTASWAFITDIVPRREAARYMGLANIATAGGSAIARLFGGVLIDSLNRASGTTSVGYTALYAIAAAFFLVSALVALPLPSRDGILAATAPSSD